VTPIAFEGQVAVVTGSGRGIGREYALGLAERGAAVIVNDVQTELADAVVAEIQSGGGKASASYDSVMTAEGGEAIVERAIQEFGAIDVLVHNAGFLRPDFFEDLSVELGRAVRTQRDVLRGDRRRVTLAEDDRPGAGVDHPDEGVADACGRDSAAEYLPGLDGRSGWSAGGMLQRPVEGPVVDHRGDVGADGAIDRGGCSGVPWQALRVRCLVLGHQDLSLPV
jgi:NAD(P)-dependent dehydrogenase (short-subunit alcohol dehydrogenase family)